ncbi:MAG: flagellar biosynthesis anti-sigma factor FlgM [Pseudomonadota bacterium]
MPIEPIGKSAIPINQATPEIQTARQPTPAQQETGKSSTVDTVSLTDSAERLRKLEKILSNLPVVDIQRVEGIRKAIDNDTYAIDPLRVADKFLRFESTLQSGFVS